MIKPGATLAARIRIDLAELAFLVERARKGWDKAKSLNDDYYLAGRLRGPICFANCLWLVIGSSTYYLYAFVVLILAALMSSLI